MGFVAMTEDDYKWADRFAYRFDEMGESEARLAKCYRSLRVDNARLKARYDDLALLWQEMQVADLRIRETSNTLRSDLAKARALAVELGGCQTCSGTGKDPDSYHRDERADPCARCSGTGLDARVPREWLTETKGPNHE